MTNANAFNRAQTNMLTTNFDVAVFPGCVWVCGEAPGSVASVWVPTVVIIQALVRVPNTKHTA